MTSDPPTFDSQPSLRGSLVALRPLRESDFESLYAVASDPLIWEQHPSWDRYKREVFAEYFKDGLATMGALLIADIRDERAIGSTRYRAYDRERSEVEIGWTFMSRAHWGGEFNRDLKQLMLRHAFRFVENVVFLVGPQNLRSQRAMEKIGGVRSGTRPADGREHIVFRITASEFAARSEMRRGDLDSID